MLTAAREAAEKVAAETATARAGEARATHQAQVEALEMRHGSHGARPRVRRCSGQMRPQGLA